MNMSEYKAGDKIYFKGNLGEIIRVTQDENEALLEVALTQTRVAYLNPSQLDLYPFAEQLNENQQMTLKKLKEEYPYRESVLSTIYWVIEYDNEPDIDDKETTQVLQVFFDWVLEQEEE